MAIRIPVDADPNLRDAFLDIEEELDFLKAPQERDNPLPSEVVALQDKVRLLQSQMNQLDLFRESEGNDADTKDGNPERVLHEDGLFKLPIDGMVNAAPPGLGNERPDVTGGTRKGHPSQVANILGSLAVTGGLSACDIRSRNLDVFNTLKVGGTLEVAGDLALTGALSGTRSSCSLYASAGQTISTATTTDILWNSEYFDNDTMHDTSSNTDRITIPSNGNYLFGGFTMWAGNSSSTRSNIITLNDSAPPVGAAMIATHVNVGPGNGDNSSRSASIVALRNLSENDILRYAVIQYSGGNIKCCDHGTYGPRGGGFWCVKISD